MSELSHDFRGSVPEILKIPLQNINTDGGLTTYRKRRLEGYDGQNEATIISHRAICVGLILIDSIRL